MSQAIDKLLEQASELAAKDDYQAALHVVDEIMRDHPNEPEVFRKRAYIFARKGDHTAAIADLSRAIAANPKEPDYFYTRGRYHAAAGDFQSAVEDFTKTIELCDFYRSDYYREPAYLMRADAYLRLKVYDKARADCDHVSDGAATWTDVATSKKAILEECRKH